MTPFIVYALPRSRTFWLSRFLSYGDWHCGHDEIRHARSMDDVRAWFSQPLTGTVETAGAPWWRLVPPDVRTVVVRRPVADVVASLAAHGFGRDMMWRLMTRLDRKLDQIEARVPGVLSVQFADLSDEAVCARVFEHCLPYRHDAGWFHAMAGLNLQADLPAMVRYFHAFRPQMEKLEKAAKHRAIAAMRPPERDIEGVTIQQESFDTWFRDGRALFEAHCVAVGESVDSWVGKNFDLMRALEANGALQFTTARSNGRLFGYLQAVISPSMESPDLTIGVHTLFYPSPVIPHLAMKLQRASIEALKKRGVGEVYWLARDRGEGTRIGALYRRLGAQPFGQFYKLELEEAA